MLPRRIGFQRLGQERRGMREIKPLPEAHGALQMTEERMPAQSFQAH